MTKNIFRPFWSFDVQKTERWLRKMALDGYHLKAINTFTRVFTFEEDKTPDDIRYHIEYSKKQIETMPTALKDDGWALTVQTRKWFVLSNKQSPEKRRTFPVRDGIVHRNRMMMYLFSGMGIYTLLTSILFIVMCGLMLFFGYSIAIQPNTFWLVVLLIGLSFWILAPYSTIKLYKTNHKYW